MLILKILLGIIVTPFVLALALIALVIVSAALAILIMFIGHCFGLPIKVEIEDVRVGTIRWFKYYPVITKDAHRND